MLSERMVHDGVSDGGDRHIIVANELVVKLNGTSTKLRLFMRYYDREKWFLNFEKGERCLNVAFDVFLQEKEQARQTNVKN